MSPPCKPLATLLSLFHAGRALPEARVRSALGPLLLDALAEAGLVVHEGGSIVLTPVRPTIDPKTAAAAAKRLIKKNSALFKRLS